MITKELLDHPLLVERVRRGVEACVGHFGPGPDIDTVISAVLEQLWVYSEKYPNALVKRDGIPLILVLCGIKYMSCLANYMRDIRRYHVFCEQYAQECPKQQTAPVHTYDMWPRICRCLSPSDQEMIDLYYYQGWTGAEIAKEKNVSPTRVYQRLRRAIRLLKRDYQQTLKRRTPLCHV